MAIIKCEKGHFYDNVKYPECPHCSAEKKKPVMDDGVTVAKLSVDKKRKNLASLIAGTDEKTVSIFSSKNTFVPVVGWLVCTEGPEKGRDYRITSGRNFIGRAYQMDITISDDTEISRENHCSIVYDPKSKEFSLIPGENLITLNGVEIHDPKPLNRYDKFTIGKSTLHFIPYCTEGVDW